MRAEESFWAWFSSIENTLFQMNEEREELFFEIKSHLEEMSPYLTFEIGPNREGKRDFVLSVGGVEDAMSWVSQLMNFAPRFEKWNLIPYRPRRKIDFGVEFNGITILPNQIHFHYEKQPDGTLELDLYLNGLEDYSQELREEMVDLVVENLLGEFDKHFRVKEQRVHFGPSLSPHLLPILELPGVVDSLKKVRT